MCICYEWVGRQQQQHVQRLWNKVCKASKIDFKYFFSYTPQQKSERFAPLDYYIARGVQT